MNAAADPIAAILAEIDRITSLLADIGKASDTAGHDVGAEDARLAIDALKKLRDKVEALAAD